VRKRKKEEMEKKRLTQREIVPHTVMTNEDTARRLRLGEEEDYCFELKNYLESEKEKELKFRIKN